MISKNKIHRVHISTYNGNSTALLINNCCIHFFVFLILKIIIMIPKNKIHCGRVHTKKSFCM